MTEREAAALVNEMVNRGYFCLAVNMGTDPNGYRVEISGFPSFDRIPTNAAIPWRAGYQGA
jgi:hypothetical protein